MTRFEGLGPPSIMALDVWLTPTILVGIKQDGRESVTLFVVSCKTLVVALDVEATADPEGVVVYGKLMPKVGYVHKVM